LTPRGYEAIPFGIQALFDLHLDWAVMHVDVENSFNNVFQTAIFRKLCDAKGFLANIIPFTKLFYGIHYFLYFEHGQHVEGVTIIKSSSSTRQGDPLGNLLIIVAHC
jgi:hypothetical protein